MYAIIGATGHTGSLVAETLLAKGERVRAVGRSKDRLAKLARNGAETVEGDIVDSGFLTKAFTGVRAVYFMVPPMPTSDDYRAFQRQVIEAGAKALEATRVHYAVALSSFGADKESGTGPVAGLHELEQRFRRIPTLKALYLRAGYFMENLLPQIDVIQNFGMMAGPIRADLPLPMVATADVGARAAESLLKLDFSGHETHELLGERDITYNEAARIVGAALGLPNLNYVQLPPDQFIQALAQMGVSKNFAALIVEMADALNDGRMAALEARTPANSAPTSLETFVQNVFVPAYRGSKAASA
jgi:uncharacterized protein YbjT (DUF2867 family)